MPNNEFETFEAPQQSKYTEPVLFLPGEYTLSKVGQIPYFAAVMSLQDLVNQIKLVEDLPEEARLDWSLEELFQRDINEERVKDELVNGYLKDPNKLSFFNSLTIALLPQKGWVIENEYGQPESIPADSYPNWEKIDVGNIHVEFGSNRSIGVVRWHKERIFPVAIDGQHRLAALKRYCEDDRDLLIPGVSTELNTKIPLIFLILDERVGFKGRSKKLLGTLREIFIDLNRNARIVPKSRRILLEDLNIQSFCVRTLLASKAKDASSDVLPLSLVGWREDEAKFDAESKFSHAITSVLNLNDIVGFCLGMRRPFEDIDRLDDNQVKKYVNGLNAKLKLARDDKENIRLHLQRCIDRQEPFSFKDKHLNAFKRAFGEQWTPHILRVFREFSPYKNYLSKARQIGADGGMLADYLLLAIEKRERFTERKKSENAAFNPRLEIDDRLGELEDLKKNEWAFYVVFQKALFINLFAFEAQNDSLEIAQTRNDFLTWWLEQINKLYEHGVFRLNWKKGKGDLWRGIAKRPDNGTIQYSRAAANRISSFITISMWFNHASIARDADAFVANLTGDNSDLPNVVQSAFNRQGMVKSGLESLIETTMDSEGLDEEELKSSRVREELVKRLRAIQAKH